MFVYCLLSTVGLVFDVNNILKKLVVSHVLLGTRVYSITFGGRGGISELAGVLFRPHI